MAAIYAYKKGVHFLLVDHQKQNISAKRKLQKEKI
jgi:hypothetical protein